MTKPRTTSDPFWKTKHLSTMTPAEWESLCDGCGQCCLHKIEDVDTGDIATTDVACAYLNLETCRCSDYANRSTNVPDCVTLTPRNISTLSWMPETCAYRLLAEGKPLEWWHPLVSGNTSSVAEAGISVRDKVVSETDVEDIEAHVTGWLAAKRPTMEREQDRFWTRPKDRRRSKKKE